MNKINFRDKKIKEGGIALFEIFILIASIVAIAYFIGEEFEVVSASGATGTCASLTGKICTASQGCIGSLVRSSDSYNCCLGSCGNSAKSTSVGEILSLTSTAAGLLAPAAPTAAPTPTAVLEGLEVPVSGPPSGPVQFDPTLNIPAEPAVPPVEIPVAGPSWSNFVGSLGANLAGILGNFAIVAGIYVAVRAIFEWSGWCPTCDSELTQAWATALALGYGAGAGLYYLANAIWETATGWAAFGSAAFVGVIGVVVAFFVMLIFYRQEYVMAVQYTCFPWKPNTGGTDCDLCNGRDFPCTKYKCQSLGQGCVLLNPGKKTQVCSWKDRNDPAPPAISPWDEALTPGFKYNPITTAIGDKGVEIKNKTGDGCLPPWTRLDYGIKLDKPGQCRIDYLRKNSFEEMTNPGLISEDSLKEYNLFSLHGGIDAANAEGLIKLPNGGNVEIYVRCLSINGVANTETFVFKYCVSDEPDETAPTIKLMDLPNGAPIQFGQTSREVKVYVNKPSDCKWSHNDEDYNAMPDSQKMTCSQTIGANTYFKCTTTLTGLKDETENKFYFNCKSYPANAEANRYSMDTNQEYKLIGTKPLVIDSVSPESGAIIKDSTQSVNVTFAVRTSAGYNNGAAKCWYKKKTEADNRYVLFSSSYNYQNSRNLWFGKGSYKYSIKCCDLPGNCATKETDFSVDTDFQSPVIVRAYNEGNNLKIMTNEKAECVYDTTSCSYTFEDGLKMTSSDSINHFTEWNTDSNFYIKCKDEFNNKPASDGCSMIVRPFSI